MFQEAAAIGGLSVQLVYYRGLSECRASRWISQPQHLAGLMQRIDCRMGHTQIGKILAHAKRETELLKVQALVFVGDAMEEEADDLSSDAAALGHLGVPVFMFQEGHDRLVEATFRDIARLTRGAWGFCFRRQLEMRCVCSLWMLEFCLRDADSAPYAAVANRFPFKLIRNCLKECRAIRAAFGLNGRAPQGHTSTHDLAPVKSGNWLGLFIWWPRRSFGKPPGPLCARA